LSLITLNGVAFDYAGEALLRDVSFAVERGERWGVIGRNGSGKTTLFRLMAGLLEPTRGSVAREGGLRITMLDQHRDFGTARTVAEAALAPFEHLLALEASLEEQAHALERDASARALARYDEDLHRFDREGGHTFRATVDALLEGLGFPAERARTQALAGLSGGERGRLGLVRQLALPGDLLLLDEPTNHLDLETTRWLEGYLLSSRNAFLAISHDRAFLANIADHILHIEAGTAFPYNAGYVHFVELRTERREAQRRAFDQQQRKISAEEEYIRRNIAGQNSRQAKGRRTRLARLPRLSPPPGEESVMAVRLHASARGGDQVLVARDVRLEVDGMLLVDRFSARVTRGEVIGIVGPNGSGKSTLLRAIAGERTVQAGELIVGSGVQLAHYRQDLAQVPRDKTLFDVIHDLRPHWERGPVQSHLGRFGFSGDEVQRISGSLSGGEQARLALAMIVLSGANLLLFDEPTNHLDVESIEALEDAIEAYPGTVLLVSHDRALLGSITTRTWALYDCTIEDFPGPFDEWADARQRRERSEREQADRSAQERRNTQKASAGRERARQQESTSQRRSAERALKSAEDHAHAIEAAVSQLTARLRDPSLYESPDGIAEARRLDEQLRTAQAELDAALEAWANLQQALDE
jgi:ATP-binding cassette subfamily F protein 3